MLDSDSPPRLCILVNFSRNSFTCIGVVLSANWALRTRCCNAVSENNTELALFLATLRNRVVVDVVVVVGVVGAEHEVIQCS